VLLPPNVLGTAEVEHLADERDGVGLPHGKRGGVKHRKVLRPLGR